MQVYGDPADFDQKWCMRDGAGELAGTRIMGLSTVSVFADSVWVAPEDSSHEADSESEISEDDDLFDITSLVHQAAAAIRQQIDIGGQSGSTACRKVELFATENQEWQHWKAMASQRK